MDMISAISNVFSTGVVAYSLWSMVPGPYPRIVAEKIGNGVGWGVTAAWNRIRGPQPISETTITIISDLATRVKGLPLLNTTGEKIDAFINRKSNAERQNVRTLEAIVAAAEKAQFPHSKDPARLRTFAAAVKEILIPNAATLSWSDLAGFGAKTILGSIWIPRACVFYYTLGWIPFNNSWLWGTTALAGLGAYSYLLLRYAGPDLGEANSKNNLQPLKNDVIESIKNQAMRDFSLTNKLGGPDAQYSDNLTMFVKELRTIGNEKTEVKQVAPPPVQPKLEPKPAATTPVKSTTKPVQPLVSKVKVDAPAYTSLNRTKIALWGNKITGDLQFQQDDLSPEEAIAFLKEQLAVVKTYLGKATDADDEILEHALRDLRIGINGEIEKYQRQIDDARAAVRRREVTRRLDRSFEAEAPTETVWSRLTSSLGLWKKAEAAPSVVERQAPPQSPVRRQQVDAPAPRTPEQSAVFGNITLSPDRTVNHLLATPNFTPVQRQGQGEHQSEL